MLSNIRNFLELSDFDFNVNIHGKDINCNANGYDNKLNNSYDSSTDCNATIYNIDSYCENSKNNNDKIIKAMISM